MPRPSYRRERKTDPILLGEPSPALTKIARMNTDKLASHIETMKVEAERLETKIENLSRINPPDTARIEALQLQQKRIAVLIDAARDRLAGKLERSRQRQSKGYHR